MYTARIENRFGESLTLSNNESRWQVASITGLNPVQAQISTTDMAGADGARFNSARLATRNVVITMAIRGSMEENRLRLYRFFRTKEACRFFFQTETRNAYIDGYVETVEVGAFDKRQKMQISILCPDPFFRSVSESKTEISNFVKHFAFPFSIEAGDPVAFSDYVGGNGTPVFNNSESETGMEITVRCLSDLSFFEISNRATGQFIRLNFPFLAGDVVYINTATGKKAIRLTRGAQTRNLFMALDVQSTFLQLPVGESYYLFNTSVGADDSAIQIAVSYRQQYGGL